MADTDVKEAHIKSLYKESDYKTRKELAVADKARKKEQDEYAKEYGSIIKDDDYWNVKSSITFIFKALTRLQDVYIKTMNSKYVTIKNVEQKKKVQKFKKDTIKELRDLSNRCLEIANVLEYDMQKPKEDK